MNSQPTSRALRANPAKPAATKPAAVRVNNAKGVAEIVSTGNCGMWVKGEMFCSQAGS